MDKILNRPTTWNLVNIKARHEQTTAHYVQAFHTLREQDPLIGFPKGGKSASLKSLIFSDLLDDDGSPQWIQITLLSYTIIDPTAFYNRRNREDITIDNWNDDIVANKKESELYFIPSVHTLAVRSTSAIRLNNIVAYLMGALNRVEPDVFDVDVIKERDYLEGILDAYAITQLYANISFSNPGHTSGFEAVFDSKLRESDASRIEITVRGSREQPLNADEDGIVRSLVNLSERNGFVKATIQRNVNSILEKADSREHPRKLVISHIINDVGATIRNTLRSIFN